MPQKANALLRGSITLEGPPTQTPTNPAIVLIAALAGELKPLTRSWAALETVEGVHGFQHPSNTIFALYGGMGAAPVTRAFRRAFQVCIPTAVYSVGWAGSLTDQAKAGTTLRPEAVVDLATHETFVCAPSNWATRGTLLTSRRVAAREEKFRLAAGYPAARAVDMEAATLGRLAAAHGLPFRAVKAISDSVDEALPDLNPFITAAGQFATARFVAHVALRPPLWPVLSRFGKQSALAAQNLADTLAAELGVEKPR